MQRTKKKQTAKLVGAEPRVRPHFEGITKKQNGITLIALIITIIVMMILVGVTVTVAMNGGLFNTADNATAKTEKETIYDQIVGAMKLKNNGNVNVKGTYDAVVDIFGEDKVEPTNPTTVEEDTAEVTFTVEGKRGTYTYKITGTKIEMLQEKSSIYDVAYILTDDSYTDKNTGETITANFVVIIRENNKLYSLSFNEDFTEFIDKCEITEILIGSKEDYSEVILEEMPDLDLETDVKEEVILWAEDDGKGVLYGIFIIVENQEVLSGNKGEEFIRNDEFDVSSIDFDEIDSIYGE